MKLDISYLKYLLKVITILRILFLESVSLEARQVGRLTYSWNDLYALAVKCNVPTCNLKPFPAILRQIILM